MVQPPFAYFRVTSSNAHRLFSNSGGATGALLPYIERTYRYGYAQVSALFVCTFLGYVVAAAGAGTLSRKVGFGHALLISIMVELAGVRSTPTLGYHW